MLILSRRKNQKLVIRINDEVVATLTVLRFDARGGVRLGMEGNMGVVFMRDELDRVIYPAKEVANATEQP